MKYYPILFLLFVVYSSCTLSNKTDVTKSVADSTIVVLDSDVIAQIEEDKRLEKYFNQVTDPICDIIYKHNSFDYVPINNKTIAWFKKCKQDLIFFYDSNHPASQLSDNAKVDSLFMELEFHFDLNNEEIIDKHLGIFNQSLRKAMIIYRITDKTIEMLQRHKNFENEQMAWERMQMALEEFYLTAEELSYTGGTGSDVLCLMSMNAIYKNREDDLKRMLSGKCPAAMNILTARRCFIHSIDSIEKDITEEFTKEEWNTWKDIPQLIDKMHKARNPLIEAFDAWIVERKKYDGCASSIMNLNQTISGER